MFPSTAAPTHLPAPTHTLTQPPDLVSFLAQSKSTSATSLYWSDPSPLSRTAPSASPEASTPVPSVPTLLAQAGLQYILAK